MAATVTNRGTTFTTTSGNTTVVATPAVGDLIVVFAASSGVATTAITDTAGGTYVQVDSNRTGFSTTGTLNAWVRTAAIASAVSTTWTATQTSSTGGGLTVFSVSGMSVFGASAVRSSGGQSTGTAVTTPAPVLSATPLTSNPVLVAIANGTSPATMTPRTGYTESTDVGYITPATGLEASFIASGETIATLTQGSTSGTVFASIALELAFNTPPTVVLNTPANAGTVATTTPTLAFTGTDADVNTIEYETQIDTVNTFNSTATITIISSYFSTASADNSSGIGNAGGFQGLAQSFTGSGLTLNSAQVYGNIFGSPTGTVCLKIYAHSGTYGTSSIPTGTALAISDLLDVTTFVTNPSIALINFVFSGANKIVLSNGTNYVLSFEGVSLVADGSNVPVIYRDSTSSTGSGNYSSELSGVWTAVSNQDMLYNVYGDSTGPLLDKYSTTDTGFINVTNGGNFHPFTSGNQISYTVQAGNALTNGLTYYWRSRGIDPTGSNAYGAWPATQSFTVSSSGAVTHNLTLLGIGS